MQGVDLDAGGMGAIAKECRQPLEPGKGSRKEHRSGDTFSFVH